MKGKERMSNKNNMTLKLEKMTISQVSENQVSRNGLSKKKILQERGITLIALVVTIIILLILAGVTLNMALSQNGLFSKTQEAADKYKQAQEDEEIEVEKIEYAAEGKEIKEVEKISDKAGFENFIKEVNEGEKTFENTLVKLYCDIDLQNEEWTPIGTTDKPFNGIFNGNGHKITNLKITSTGEEPSGLFGCATGIIENIGIESGSITASGIVGGIVGSFTGTIENCYNKVNITANIKGSATENDRTAGVGGIVGKNKGDVNIIRCKNTGDITVTETGCTKWAGLAGGIFGTSCLKCEECINEGDITLVTDGDNPICGGIGAQSGDFKYCYNTGNIICEISDNENKFTAAGGIVGQIDDNKPTVIGCFSVGTAKIKDIAGSIREGEISGESFVSLETCFGIKHDNIHLCGDDRFDTKHEYDKNLFETEKEVYDKIIEKFPEVFTWSGDKVVLKWELNV